MTHLLSRLSFFIVNQLPYAFLHVLPFLYSFYTDYDEVIYIVVSEVTFTVNVTGQVSAIAQLDTGGRVSAIAQLDTGGRVSAIAPLDTSGQVSAIAPLRITGLVVEDYIFLYHRTGGIDNQTVELTLRKTTGGTPLARAIQLIPTGQTLYIEISYDGTTYGPEIEVPPNTPLRIPAAARKLRVRTPQTNVCEFLPTSYWRRR